MSIELVLERIAQIESMLTPSAPASGTTAQSATAASAASTTSQAPATGSFADTLSTALSPATTADANAASSAMDAAVAQSATASAADGAAPYAASATAATATAATAQPSLASILEAALESSGTQTTAATATAATAQPSLASILEAALESSGTQTTGTTATPASAALVAALESSQPSANATVPLSGAATLADGAPLATAASASTPAAPVSDAAGNQAIVQIAQSQVGVTEQPPGSNDSPAIATYRSATAGAIAGAPWCAYFASWVARQAGTPLGVDGQGFGAVRDIWSWAQDTGRAVPNGPGVVPAPGDLIVFGDHHVGIVDQVLPNGDIETIEGNYDNNVAQVIRGPGEATGYVRMS
jgi:hypothetical protein